MWASEWIDAGFQLNCAEVTYDYVPTGVRSQVTAIHGMYVRTGDPSLGTYHKLCRAKLNK